MNSTNPTYTNATPNIPIVYLPVRIMAAPEAFVASMILIS